MCVLELVLTLQYANVFLLKMYHALTTIIGQGGNLTFHNYFLEVCLFRCGIFINFVRSFEIWADFFDRAPELFIRWMAIK